ncbi:MAG: PfkB family carbohydrate kinase [Acidobacteria bacterium]|nr:PfkB family carbohydrate kinase [Acidobacteriota bacterium]
MSLLVVGSVAFDSIRTPHGEVDGILGGSATFFSVAASWFGPVKVVAVVGDDFGEEHLEVFRLRSIETSGLERAPGKTFRWHGEYSGNMNEARTLDVHLNVFEKFSPRIPPSHISSEFVFLGNIDPRLQLHVRRQLPRARLVACDSMNYWIEGSLKELKETLSAVDAIVVNEGEARMLSGRQNLRQAATEIQKMGPRIVVIKRGEYGVALFNNGSIFSTPAFMLEEFKDPTGAGDSFAGGFMGYLAKTGDFSEANLRRAVAYGSVMASFAVEEFGLKRLLGLTPQVIEARMRDFMRLTQLDV